MPGSGVQRVRSVGLGSLRVVPNAVAVRPLASVALFSDDLFLLFDTLAPLSGTLEVLR